MRRVNPRTIALVALGLLLLVVAALVLGRSGNKQQDKLSDEQATGKAGETAAPASRCASQATYDRIKAELFRQAAQVRQNDQAAFDRLAAYASARVERPVLKERDEELGTLRCGGRLSIDLPPGLAVAGGRRTLSADIDYVLQPAADGSGDVVMLEGADPIIIPLATLTRTGSGPALPAPAVQQAPGTMAENVQLRPPPVPIPTPAPQQPAVEPAPAAPPQSSSSARPSFNFRYARTKGEIAVCSDARLASLDRQMASQYYRALAGADPRQRALLARTRDSFLRFRDRCPSEACVAETYRGRMREIRDIMAGTWHP
jgi:hypothetical protein